MGIAPQHLGLERSRLARVGGAVLAAGLVVCACSSGSDGSSEASRNELDRPTIVVTTNILGDVVRHSVGDAAHVEVIMPLESDPHDFAPSARQAEAMEQADLLVINGAGFEDAMGDIILNAADSGTTIFTAADHVSLLSLDGEVGQSDGKNSGGTPDAGADPHIWTDPDRIAAVVAELGVAASEIDGIDSDRLTSSLDAYITELDDLSDAMSATLATVPVDQRLLVTNHEVFGYFADRFDFEVIGTIIPSLSTGAEPSSAALERLATLIEEEHVPAVFAETTTSSRLAGVLADEIEGEMAGEVVVVELFSESLGEPGSGAETYVAMMATNAALIADALTRK